MAYVFFFKQKTAYEIGLGIPAEPLFRSVKILIFAAEGLTKRSAVGFLLRSLIMFQTFISRHNSNFFSDKLVLTSVTPASSAPVLQTPKATSSTLYFDSLTVNAGNGDRKSGSAGMPRPISYAVFCLKKKNTTRNGVRLKALCAVSQSIVK